MGAIRNHGRVPRSLHAEYYSEPGVAAREEIHSSSGVNGDWSRKYHYRHFPTRQSRDPHKLPLDLRPQPLPPLPLQPWHLRAARIKAHGDVVSGRVPLLYGESTFVFGAKFERSCPADRFFHNGDGHELWYVHEGRGLLASEYGVLPFRPGHFVVVPKATSYRVELESEDCCLLLIESRFPIVQTHAMTPMVDTEIDSPEFRLPRDEEGEFRIWTKHNGGFVTEMFLGHHPFDLIGWHGSLYPFALHSDDARPTEILGRRTSLFESGCVNARGFSVGMATGSDEAARQNADSDEAVFFANARVGARKGSVERGSLTFHAGSLPHAPQATTITRLHDERGNLAHDQVVSLQTCFEPLAVAKQAMGIAEKDYVTREFRSAQSIPVE